MIEKIGNIGIRQENLEKPLEKKLDEKNISDLEIDLRIIDSTNKALTARSPETIKMFTGLDYAELFGLSKTKKAFLEIIKSQPIDISHDEINNIFFELDKTKRNLLKEDNIKPDEYEILTDFIKKNLPDIEIPDKSILNKYTDDQLLNIGDPYQKIGQEIDEERIWTIDYEYDTEIRANTTRTMEQVYNKVMEPLTNGYKGNFFDTYSSGISGIKNYLENIDEEESIDESVITKKDVDWLFGHTNENGEYQTGIHEKVQKGVNKLELLLREPNIANFEQGIQIWDEIGKDMEARKKRILEESINKEHQEDNHSMYNDIDMVNKNLFYLQKNASEGLKVIYHYKNRVFWPAFKPYVNILKNFHEEIFRDNYSTKNTNKNLYSDDAKEHDMLSEFDYSYNVDVYKSEWRSFLIDHDKDPEEYMPSDFELTKDLLKFYTIKGSNMTMCCSKDIFKEIRKKEIDLLSKEFKAEIKPKNAKILKGMFPFTKNLLPDNHFDVIMASWSISVHMFPEMDQQKLVDEVWPEVDRILKKDGKATFFPMDHYFDGYEDVAKSINLYNKQYNRNLQFKLFDNPDDEYLILEITKE